jgi:hypothetical protein
MSTHLDAAHGAAAYKPTSSTGWLAAARDAFAVLHDIQWRAPWENEPAKADNRRPQ